MHDEEHTDHHVIGIITQTRNGRQADRPGIPKGNVHFIDFCEISTE